MKSLALPIILIIVAFAPRPSHCGCEIFEPAVSNRIAISKDEKILSLLKDLDVPTVSGEVRVEDYRFRGAVDQSIAKETLVGVVLERLHLVADALIDISKGEDVSGRSMNYSAYRVLRALALSNRVPIVDAIRALPFTMRGAWKLINGLAQIRKKVLPLKDLFAKLDDNYVFQRLVGLHPARMIRYLALEKGLRVPERRDLSDLNELGEVDLVPISRLEFFREWESLPEDTIVRKRFSVGTRFMGAKQF